MPVSEARPIARDRTAWCYPSGLVSAMDDRLLSRRATLDLLALGSLDDVLARVGQTLTLPRPPEATEPFELAEAAEAGYAAALRQLAKAAPSPALSDIFLLPIEWRAFRAYLHAEALGRERVRVPGAEVPDATWAECWSSYDVEPPFDLFAAAAQALRKGTAREDLDEQIIGEVTLAFEARDVMRAARDAGGTGVPPVVITWLRLRLALDLLRLRSLGWSHQSHEAALSAVGADGKDLLALATSDRADWRASFTRLGLPEAATIAEGDPSPAIAIERLIDNAVTRLAREGRYVPFGPEPVFAFLWALRIEAINLRLVLSGVAAGMDADAVARDIRDTYA